MRVPRPRIETLRRSIAGQLTVGDFGIATTTTALIDFVDSLERAGVPELSGYSLRHSIPFQLSGAVADALLDPTRAVPGVAWAAYRVDVCWLDVPNANEPLTSRTQADHVSANLVRVSAVASSAGRQILTGRIHYVRVRNGINLATDSAISECGESHSSQSGALRSQHYTPFLIKLLMNPLAGGREPLGRRLHPLGSVPLAALVFQAAQQYPETNVIAASIKYLSPMRTDLGFTVTTERSHDDSVALVMTNDAGVRFATAKASLLAKLPNESAEAGARSVASDGN